jgi:SulP family sulfate permease
MPSRRESLEPNASSAPMAAVPISVALRRALATGYDAEALRADLLAGLVVGIVALPLSMALGIAVGVPPQHGLYTAIVAGAVAALCGGSKFQVTGPTAAFVVILAPIVTAHGLPGLLTAGLLAGVILVAMGASRLGRFIQFIPYPVTTGFTAGIAVVIATLQLKDLFGLAVAHMPEHFPDKVVALWAARGTVSPADLGVGAATLALLVWLPRLTRRVPAPLLALAIVTVLVWAMGLTVDTLGTRFHTVIDGRAIPGIPSLPPAPALPWGEVRSPWASCASCCPRRSRSPCWARSSHCCRPSSPTA